MRTAELLEIASLCEGQKSTSSRGPLSQNSYSTGFTIGDFERLVGTKRAKKEASPTPNKVRRLSGESCHCAVLNLEYFTDSHFFLLSSL